MPIDVSYPKPLLEDIISDSQPAAILTIQELVPQVNGEWLILQGMSYTIL